MGRSQTRLQLGCRWPEPPAGRGLKHLAPPALRSQRLEIGFNTVPFATFKTEILSSPSAESACLCPIAPGTLTWNNDEALPSSIFDSCDLCGSRNHMHGKQFCTSPSACLDHCESRSSFFRIGRGGNPASLDV